MKQPSESKQTESSSDGLAEQLHAVELLWPCRKWGPVFRLVRCHKDMAREDLQYLLIILISMWVQQYIETTHEILIDSCIFLLLEAIL